MADGWGPTAAQLVKHWAPAHGNQDGHYYFCIGTGKAAGTNQTMAHGSRPHESSWSHLISWAHGCACPAWPCSGCPLIRCIRCTLPGLLTPTPHLVKSSHAHACISAMKSGCHYLWRFFFPGLLLILRSKQTLVASRHFFWSWRVGPGIWVNGCLVCKIDAGSILAEWRLWEGFVGLVLFSSLPAEKDQVALTASMQLVVCCIVPATVRCKGVEIIAGESGNPSSRLSFLVKTDAWLYKMFGSIY